MVLITLICVLTGLGFAALATWLSTTKGNTISDILKANKLENAEAIRVEISKVVSVSSSVPIVAMYVLAVVSAFGLPAFIYWRTLSDSRPIHLFGSFTDSEENRLRQGDVR